MKRRILNFLLRRLVVVCTALLLACVVLWARSHRGGATATWTGGGRCSWITVYPGYVIAGSTPDTFGLGAGVKFMPRALELSVSWPRSTRTYAAAGVGLVVSPIPGRGADWYLAVSFWLLVALLAPLPAAWAVARVRHRVNLRRAGRRGRAGLCPGCGYDLRATPGRCPECGRVTPQVA